MTPVPLRKVIIFCSALAATASLCGCDDHAMDKVLAEVQAIKVDAHDPANRSSPDDRHLNKADIDLALQTARDLTVNKGGLLDKNKSADAIYSQPGQGAQGAAKPDESLYSAPPQAPKMQIAVVDPLDMKRPDSDTPLDERLKGVVFETANAAMAAATHDLPDIPVGQTPKAQADAPKVEKVASQPKPDDTANGHHIQIGSFGTLTAAKGAWADLRDRYASLGDFQPSFEKALTAAGKPIVRLKVGPVRDEAQARSLCDKLAIHDSWCARAG